MKTLIVYDSVFGNTEKIAQAMGAALLAPVVKVGDVKPTQLLGLDLLLVGSPTRAFHATPATGKFLKGIARNGLAGVRVAGFDTRMDVAKTDVKILTFMAGIFGYAAEPIARALVRKGGQQAQPPAGFMVTASEGPLAEGELERAKAWAKKVAG